MEEKSGDERAVEKRAKVRKGKIECVVNELCRDGDARCSFGVLVAWAGASADSRIVGGGLLAVHGCN